jgi:peptidoglycan/xylan/chitin deacetylase (PgdA/CDA1 family)
LTIKISNEKDEEADMSEAIRLHTEVTGSPPKGWYTGRSSINTIKLAAKTGIFSYIADSYADDLPYWEEFSDKDQLIVPYTLDANDMRFANPTRLQFWNTILRIFKR